MRARILAGSMGVALVIAWGVLASRTDSQSMASVEQRNAEHPSPPDSTRDVAGVSAEVVGGVPIPMQWRDDEENWLLLRAMPDDAARRERMVALVEEIATRDPALARTFAQAESDPGLSARLLAAMMRGWARHDIDAAARWARGQSGVLKEKMLASLFAGACDRPEVIVAFAQTLFREEPSLTKEVGASLIHALGRGGNHESAATFAATGEGSAYDDWLVSAYSRWGHKNPEEAVLHAIALADPAKRLHAFRAAVTGWAQADPRSLLETARTFPEGSEKTFSMTVGLRVWVEQDAAAVARWVASNQR